jgi:hypothetical protein
LDISSRTVAFAYQHMKVQYGAPCHATTGSTHHALIHGSRSIRPARFVREVPIEEHNCTGCGRELTTALKFQDSELQYIQTY